MKYSVSLIFFMTILLCSCENKSDNKTDSSKTEDDTKVTIIAKDFNFDTKPEIPSGWLDFEFKNEGHAEHFYLLSKLPDTVTYKRYLQEVTRPFDIVFDSLKGGMAVPEALTLLGSSVAGWYFTDTDQMGGSGVISPGMSTTNYIKLDPGNYVMECYIKEKGQFHTTLGMIRPLIVTQEQSERSAPQHDIMISIKDSTYEIVGDLSAGSHIVGVKFLEHPQYELGNDVHLIRSDKKINTDSVIHWLNWMNIKGLEPPAPVKFIGGTQEMPIGHTTYFTVDLEPGYNYAWIAESGAYRGLYKEFNIVE